MRPARDARLHPWTYGTTQAKEQLRPVGGPAWQTGRYSGTAAGRRVPLYLAILRPASTPSSKCSLISADLDNGELQWSSRHAGREDALDRRRRASWVWAGRAAPLQPMYCCALGAARAHTVAMCAARRCRMLPARRGLAEGRNMMGLGRGGAPGRRGGAAEQRRGRVLQGWGDRAVWATAADRG